MDGSPYSHDLRGMREAAGLTTEDMAERLGVSPEVVTAQEADPDNVVMEQIRRWMEATGHAGGGEAINPGTPYALFTGEVLTTTRYLQGWTEEVPGLAAPLPSAAELAAKLRRLVRKPRVVLCGSFDAAKTTLASRLLGLAPGTLPASFSPTTSLMVELRHLDDRPDWLDGEVAYFRAGIDLDRVDESDHATSCLVRQDTLQSLGRYATHRGETSDAEEAEFAVVYLAAEALKAFRVIDLPGLGSGNQGDEDKVARAIGLADVLLYLSPAIRFLTEIDFLVLPLLLRALPQVPGLDPLETVFIVASHADGPGAGLEAILDSGAVRLHRQLIDSVSPEEGGTAMPTEADLRRRFFTFSAQQPVLAAELSASLETLLGRTLPAPFMAQLRHTAADMFDSAVQSCEAQEKALLALKADREEAHRELDRLKATEMERDDLVRQGQSRITELITNEFAAAKEDVDDILERGLTIESIEERIRQSFADNEKDDARERALPLIVGLLQAEVSGAAMARMERIEGEVRQFIGDYNAYFDPGEAMARLELPRLDTARMFRVGTASAGLVLGTLSTMGITVLFPIAPLLGMALAIFSTYSLIRTLRQGWQRVMAQRIRQRLHEAAFGPALQKAVRRMFREVGERFDLGVRDMEVGAKSYQSRLDAVLDGESSDEAIDAMLDLTRRFTVFLRLIPWSRS